MAAYKAVLADEQVLFTEGIKKILHDMDNPRVEVIAAAHTGKDLLELIEGKEIDLVLFELNFSDIDYDQLIQKLRANNPGVKLLILSAYGEMKLVRSCFNKGIDGFILKSNSLDSLRDGILEVMQDNIFMGEGLMVAPPNQKETNEKQGISHVNDRFKIKQKLTKRENEILDLICQGLNNRQISKELFISDQTVGVHKKNIMKKLDVNSTPALIEFAKENKIVG